MIEIQRYDYDKVWGMEKHKLGDYVQYDDHAAIVAQLEQRNSGLKAARIAYASELPLNSKGEPDVGSIHQNIRKLKADYAQLESDLAEANDYIDKINTIYQKDEIFVVKNGEGFYTDKFDSVIMTNVVAIKEQGK